MIWRARIGDVPLSIVLRLKSIDHLFEPPDLSPFDPYFAPYSFGPAIAYVAEELQRVSRRRAPELTVLLPPEAIAATPCIEERTREALRRYAAAWSIAAQQAHAVERRQARTIAGGAMLFFAGSNLLSLHFAQTGSLLGATGDLVDVLLDGLGVGAWVALWWPFDQLFQAWQHRLEERTYRTLPDIALRVLPDPEPPSDDGS